MIRRFLEMKVDIMAVAQVLGPVGWVITAWILSAAITLRSFEIDTREGTIACDGAKSIIVNDAIYCKKAEEEG